MPAEKALVWFRRDLRDDNHAALGAALAEAEAVYCAFVFDRDILDALPDRRDRRVDFIRRDVPELAAVPDRHIHAPWRIGRLEQEALGVVIGRDYPAPIIDHAQARGKTPARYAVVWQP